jgi:hypothetical protein
VRSLALLTALTLLAALGPAASRGQPAPPAAGPAPVPTFSPANGANLNISPKRVTLDRNHRTGTIYVFNQGTGAATFDISLVDRAMMPDGQIVPVADAQGNPETKAVADRVQSAQAILQISPRRITLNPGQGQTIRLRISGAPDDAAAVEMRSHLTISSLPPREAGTTAEAAAANAPSNELRFQINALLGLSVPAIVRLTDPDVRAGIENARITIERAAAAGPPTPVLSFDLVRVGANSLFGNVEVRVQGQPREPAIGLARGVGVYTEINRRSMQIALSRAPAPGEHLEVTFTDDDTSPGKLLAKSVL